MKMAKSGTRVEDQTAGHVNEAIRRQTEMSIAYHAANPGQIERRLRELDAEWDVERALQTGAASLSLFGLTLGTVRRKWFLLPTVVMGFFLQHALQGWCPPIEVFRRIGFRTRREIETERNALMAIRGDFEEFAGSRKKTASTRREPAGRA